MNTIMKGNIKAYAYCLPCAKHYNQIFVLHSLIYEVLIMKSPFMEEETEIKRLNGY